MCLHRGEARARHLTLVAGLVLIASACGEERERTEPIAVVGATLIDGSAGAPRADAVVIMRNGRFSCVGDEATCPVSPDARVIDGDGHWITPGLIDTHVHLWWQEDSIWTAASQRIRLSAGITTVREMASAGQLRAVLRAAGKAEAGDHPGPRVHVSGRVAQHQDSVLDPEVYSRLVEELIEAGVDGLKLKSPLPREVLARVLDEAERSGSDLYGHALDVARTLDELDRAFALGFAGVVHVGLLAPLLQSSEAPPAGTSKNRPAWIDLWRNTDPDLENRLIEAMLHEDVWLESTMVGTYLQLDPDAYAGAPALEWLPGYLVERLDGDALDAADRADAFESLRRMYAFVARFKARGGTLAVGTDQMAFPALGIHIELALLVDAGLTPHEAVRAATADAARVLGWQDRLGTVETGKTADMVLMAADPLADIRNTREVRRVFKGGVEHDPAALLAGVRGAAE